MNAEEFVKQNGGIESIKNRLLPEGMEWLLDVWPKWSNGEYCKFGDRWTAKEYYRGREVQTLERLVIISPKQLKEWEQDEGENFGYEFNFLRAQDTTYRPNKEEPDSWEKIEFDLAKMLADSEDAIEIIERVKKLAKEE